MFTADQIRELFLSFFEKRGHLRMPSASLVPAGDPTLLFTSAGMVPFKPFFMAEQQPPSYRLTSSQKSFRTTDIDEVGDDTHLTFFEMLGNFSIGEYFKDESIRLAWELVTSVEDGFGLKKDSIFVTVYLDDEETYNFWKNEIGIAENKIFRYGDEDNWWGPAGEEGPTGPCSELHFDFGMNMGCGGNFRKAISDADGCHPNHNCGRFVELWNLVFMQYYQNTTGKRTLLNKPCVDTGMGLERAASVLQGTSNVYDTDLFSDLISEVGSMIEEKYGINEKIDYAYRVVVEHTRASVFLISDGVIPSNEGRGYVLRRIIRRAIRYGRSLGMTEGFMLKVGQSVINQFSHVYRELTENQDFIAKVLKMEDEKFGQAVERGSMILDGMLEVRHWYLENISSILDRHIVFLLEESASRDQEMRVGLTREYGHYRSNKVDSLNEEAMPPTEAFVELGIEHALSKMIEQCRRLLNQASCDKSDLKEMKKLLLERFDNRISGEEAFYLWDTHGFPVEETVSIGKTAGLGVNLEEFHQAVGKHRESAKAAHVVGGGMGIVDKYGMLNQRNVPFVGHANLHREATVIGLLLQNQPVENVTCGDSIELILDETPFYPEGGGQIGDAGFIEGPNGVMQVLDTQSPLANLIVHYGQVISGDVSLNDKIVAKVDVKRRVDTARNHSGTHILHASLRQVLGLHVRQAGSLVAPDRLRFDYSHVGPLTNEELMAVQLLSNERVRDNLKVIIHETTYAEAIKQGALAFFGDKYGDKVRVVEMSASDSTSPFSLELCGGTHVHATGQVGPIFLLGETGIGGGMRRLEGVTGFGAEQLFIERSSILERVSQRLEVPQSELENRLRNFMDELSFLKKEIALVEQRNVFAEADKLVESIVQVNGINVLSTRCDLTNVDSLRQIGDSLKNRISSLILVLAIVVDDKALLVSMVTPDLIEKGLKAGDVVKEVARVIGGSGGGSAELAQAGGKDIENLGKALSLVYEIVKREVKP